MPASAPRAARAACPAHTACPVRASIVAAPLAALLCLTLAAPSPARAAGFSQGLQGAGSSGVAGAATARADLPEAGYYNPAAFGLHGGLQLGVGTAAIFASMAHRPPAGAPDAGTDALTSPAIPPYAHAAVGMGPLAAGLSFAVPFGSALTWPEDWPGRYQITSIALRTYELAMATAWRPHERVSLALGPRLLWADVEYSRRVDTVNPAQEGHVHLGAEARAWGLQAALLVAPTDRLTLGLSWRSRATVDFEGAAHFENIPLELAHRAHDSAASTRLTLPDRLALGAAYHFGVGIASLDLEYTTWSTFERFDVRFASAAMADLSEPRHWHDTLAVRAGWEHHGLATGLVLRAGLAYDPSPSPASTLSPASPDSDRVLVTLGAGYELGHGLGLDASYGHIFFGNATATGEAFAGSYRASAELLAIGLRYRPTSP